MKKNVKILSVLLVLALFAAMAIGSGSDKEAEVKAPSSVTTEGQSTTVNAADSSTKTETQSSTNTETKAENKSKDDASITIEETVLLDQGDIKITAKSINTNGLFGPEVKMLFENNSGKSVTIQARNASVNGYMFDPMMSVDVVAGKKANDALTIPTSDLQLVGITTIADIEFVFHVFDSETWNDIFDSEVIRIETSAMNDYHYTFDNSGNQAYNDKGVEIVIKGLATEDTWLGKAVVVYVHNESAKSITVQARDVSVNGFMIDPVFSCDVAAGKHALDTITFMSSDLEKNEITDIESIELSFHIFDGDTWDTIADSPVITVNFN